MNLRTKKPMLVCALVLSLTFITGCATSTSETDKSDGGSPANSQSAEASTTQQGQEESPSASAKSTTESSPQSSTSSEAAAAPAAVADFAQPIVHKGEGAGEFSLNGLADKAAVLLFVKNFQPGQLGVEAVSTSGSKPLVSVASGHYDGTVLALAGTKNVKVSAAGGWMIKVMPVKTIRQQGGGSVISGNGDDVIAYKGTQKTASIQAFGGWATVSVLAPGSTEAKSGESAVLNDGQTNYLVIKADKSWRISLS